MNTIDLRKYMNDEFIRSLMIGERLEKFWEDTPIDPDNDWDLNPHLYLKQVSSSIAKDIEGTGVPCTTEDVLLYWLTMAVHQKLFLPK